MAPNTYVTNNAIINCFWAWWPHGKDFQVRNIRPSWLFSRTNGSKRWQCVNARIRA